MSLKDLVDDDSIENILIVGRDQVFVEGVGKTTLMCALCAEMDPPAAPARDEETGKL